MIPVLMGQSGQNRGQLQVMGRTVRLALWSATMLVSFALAQPHSALAQMMPDELMAKNLGSKEERMKKSSIDGPGMKSLGPNDPQWCRPCHLNHDKVRASR